MQASNIKYLKTNKDRHTDSLVTRQPDIQKPSIRLADNHTNGQLDNQTTENLERKRQLKIWKEKKLDS